VNAIQSVRPMQFDVFYRMVKERIDLATYFMRQCTWTHVLTQLRRRTNQRKRAVCDNKIE
jgi:hypothetical protein